MKFQGCFVALVTPFEDGAVDYDRFAKLIAFHRKAGTAALVPVGTTGESPTLSHEEHEEVIRFTVREAGGKVPVLAGTGSNSTAEALRLTRSAENSGADGALVVSPYYNKPTQEGLFLHFRDVAGAVGIPICLYNIPGRTGVNIAPETMERLAAVKNVVAVKEAAGSLDQVSEIRARTGLSVLSGDDSLTLPMMAVGARGVISVSANLIPREIGRMVALALEDRFAQARKIHERFFALHKALFIETNPIPIKTAMEILGRMKGEMRPPLGPMSALNRDRLRKALKEAGVR